MSCLFNVVCVCVCVCVFCQVQVSATDRSLVQRRPTECGAFKTVLSQNPNDDET